MRERGREVVDEGEGALLAVMECRQGRSGVMNCRC